MADSYRAGERATIVGYSQGSGDDEPFYGWLRVDPTEAYRDPAPDVWPFVHPTDVRLGEVTIQQTAPKGWAMFRLSLSFTLPESLAADSYEVIICNDPCTQGFGDVIGATVYVGVEPQTPLTREWPIDEPAIARLDDDALVFSPDVAGYALTAAQIRRGETAPDPVPITEAPTRPDVEAAGESGGGSGGGSGRLGLYLVGVAAAGVAFVGLRRVGPGRKQVHTGGDSGGSGGQGAAGGSRWPGRVVRL